VTIEFTGLENDGVIIIINEFHRDASLKENFRAAKIPEWNLADWKITDCTNTVLHCLEASVTTILFVKEQHKNAIDIIAKKN